MTPAATTARRLALAAAAFAPLLLFLLLELQRPFPFSTTNDNWGYFLPLMTKTTSAWLDGHSLRVVWELGQGWSPWDSGQVGWLSPFPVVAALITRLLDDPLALLEVDAGLHLLLLGLAAVIAPPARFSGWTRVALALALGLAPGPIIVGMNWHDYLTPAPWFVLLLGLVWRAVDDDRCWTARESAAVVVVSLLFFSAAHPQMVVLGHACLTLFAFTCARSRAGIDVVVRLAVAQLAVMPALFYLMWAAADGSAMWRYARANSSLLEGALDPVDGLGAITMGPWTADHAAAFFNPMLLLLIVVGIALRQIRFALAALVLVVLLVPSVFPPVGALFVGGLSSFRFPSKFACFAGPVAAALWFVLAAHRHQVVAVVVAACGVVVCLLGNEGGTTFNAAHGIGARGLQALGDRCLDEAGVGPGERIAFIGDLKHSRTFADTPLALMAVANNAPVVMGRGSAHLYEPLEPDDLARAHAGLTAFWRGTTLPIMRDPRRLELVRRSGAGWLLAVHQEELLTLPSTKVCDVWFARMPGAKTFPGDDVVSDSAGVLTAPPRASAPVTDTARPLPWQQLDDGSWRAQPPLPRSDWWTATLCGLVLSAVLLRHLPQLPRARA